MKKKNQILMNNIQILNKKIKMKIKKIRKNMLQVK